MHVLFSGLLLLNFLELLNSKNMVSLFKSLWEWYEMVIIDIFLLLLVIDGVVVAVIVDGVVIVVRYGQIICG